MDANYQCHVIIHVYVHSHIMLLLSDCIHSVTVLLLLNQEDIIYIGHYILYIIRTLDFISKARAA